VQDKITRNIALAMQVQLTEGETARLWEGQTTNLRAWEKMVQAREVFSRYTSIDTGIARKLLEEVLLIDPDFAAALALLGTTYFWDARFTLSMDKEQSLHLAEVQADKILALNPEMGAAYTLRGMIAFLRDQLDAAIDFSQKAVELAPSDFRALTYLGQCYVYAGTPEKALTTLKTAARLKPYRESWLTYYITLSHLWIGNLAAALESAELYLHQEPDEPYGLMYLAVVYGFLEQNGKARESVAQLKERFPAFSIRNVLLSERYKNQEQLDRILSVLRAAGLPE
jgi:tetratricopeptide (TPR) repeat protein